MGILHFKDFNIYDMNMILTTHVYSKLNVRIIAVKHKNILAVSERLLDTKKYG